MAIKIKIGESVVLNEHELKLCEYLAKKRYGISRKSGVPNAKIGKQSNEQTDFDGVCGELAFCKLANIYPKDIFIIHPKSAKGGSDKKGDVIYNGYTVDIKTTIYRSGHLLATSSKQPNFDFFALMIREGNKFTFKGFMASTELLSEKRLDFFKGQKIKSYIAKQEELKEI